MAKAGPRKAAMLAGLKTYFTGNACSKGHIAERYVVDKSCTKCRAETSVRTNPLRKAYRAEWFQKNKEKKTAKNMKWRSENSELVEEINAASRYKNRLKYCAKQNERRKNNRELENKRMRDWRAANPERHLAYRRELSVLYRAKKGRNDGWFKATDLEQVLIGQNFKCVYCPNDLGDSFHFDHREPFSRVGGGNPTNIQCVCADCNFRKGAKDHETFAAIKVMEMQQNA